MSIVPQPLATWKQQLRLASIKGHSAHGRTGEKKKCGRTSSHDEHHGREQVAARGRDDFRARSRAARRLYVGSPNGAARSSHRAQRSAVALDLKQRGTLLTTR